MNINPLLSLSNIPGMPDLLNYGYGSQQRFFPEMPNFFADLPAATGNPNATTTTKTSGGQSGTTDLLNTAAIVGTIGGLANKAITGLTGVNPAKEAVKWVKEQALPTLTNNYGFGDVSPDFGSPMEGFDFTPDNVSGSFGDTDLAGGIGDLVPDELKTGDLLNSPYLNIPTAALSLYGFAKDPSVTSGASAALNTVGALNSLPGIGGFLPAGFSTLPFALPLLAAQFGNAIDPGKTTASADFEIDASGKVNPKGLNAGNSGTADYVNQLRQQVMAELGKLGELKPTMGQTPGILQPGGQMTGMGEGPAQFVISHNHDNKDQVGVLMRIQTPDGPMVNDVVYTGAPDPAAIARAVADASEKYRDRAAMNELIAKNQADWAYTQAAGTR